MTHILIPTMPDDGHAIYTQLALNKMGHHCTLWYPSDFPTQQTHSFRIQNKTVSWRSHGKNMDVTNPKYDTVWYRRPRKPTLSESLHPDDRTNSQKENMALYNSFWHVIAPDARWINPPERANAANCKLLQLKIASQVGLKTAPTLISNDPDDIKEFINKHEEGNVIHKTLYPLAWYEKEMRMSYTRPVTLSDLPANPVLQSTPGIFQSKIPKAFELRLTYMGGHIISVKLDSQKHPKGLLDWRYVPTHELSIEEFNLPENVAVLCRQFMKKSGLEFGCLDFIVTPDDEYYFLEVNEQGQFLWLEQINPKIKMLDTFARFLTNSNDIFSCGNSSSPLSISEFSTETAKSRRMR